MDMPWTISPVTVESCALPPVAAASARVRAQSHWQGKGAARPPRAGDVILVTDGKEQVEIGSQSVIVSHQVHV